ncbi:Oxysterol-binding protein-related protein 2A [Morella rubra]|uniref:Oxysterol-binding protein-related protein 2A n=1 Tax=Morella rubra TaxID=262757 RepID=A0A6A1VH88_9ROSI|nr:Oxysterol-binding protein-related protein 2A [Morella rubra]
MHGSNWLLSFIKRSCYRRCFYPWQEDSVGNRVDRKTNRTLTWRRNKRESCKGLQADHLNHILLLYTFERSLPSENFEYFMEPTDSCGSTKIVSNLLDNYREVESHSDVGKMLTQEEVSEYASSEGRHCKPFNPLLGETYEADYPEKGIRFFSEKVEQCKSEIVAYKEKGDELEGHMKELLARFGSFEDKIDQIMGSFVMSLACSS